MTSNRRSIAVSLCSALKQHLAMPATLICRGAVAFDVLRIHPHDLDGAIVGAAGVGDGFVDALVGVQQMDVFADHPDAYLMLRLNDALDDGLPFTHVGR